MRIIFGFVFDGDMETSLGLKLNKNDWYVGKIVVDMMIVRTINKSISVTGYLIVFRKFSLAFCF